MTSTPRKRPSVEQERFNRWVGEFRARLARLGYRPGRRWVREFYIDMFPFLTRAVRVIGGNSFELGLRVAVRELERERGEVDSASSIGSV